ncbi:MAG: 1-acyl-sn-glycerol-3-phosphate acyltransferase, partial [Henriciella sp.]
VQEKRTPQKTRETLTRTKQALSEGKCVIIFPSGRLAKRIEGKLTEQEWMSSAVSLARKYDTPIQPLNVSAENSKLFYLLSAINGQLRDITLFNELLNKKNSRFGLNFGPLIDPNSLIGDANAVTVALRDYVSTDLGQQPDEAFEREQ